MLCTSTRLTCLLSFKLHMRIDDNEDRASAIISTINDEGYQRGLDALYTSYHLSQTPSPPLDNTFDIVYAFSKEPHPVCAMLSFLFCIFLVTDGSMFEVLHVILFSAPSCVLLQKIPNLICGLVKLSWSREMTSLELRLVVAQLKKALELDGVAIGCRKLPMLVLLPKVIEGQAHNDVARIAILSSYLPFVEESSLDRTVFYLIRFVLKACTRFLSSDAAPHKDSEGRALPLSLNACKRFRRHLRSIRAQFTCADDSLLMYHAFVQMLLHFAFTLQTSTISSIPCSSLLHSFNYFMRSHCADAGAIKLMKIVILELFDSREYWRIHLVKLVMNAWLKLDKCQRVHLWMVSLLLSAANLKSRMLSAYVVNLDSATARHALTLCDNVELNSIVLHRCVEEFSQSSLQHLTLHLNVSMRIQLSNCYFDYFGVPLVPLDAKLPATFNSLHAAITENPLQAQNLNSKDCDSSNPPDSAHFHHRDSGPRRSLKHSDKASSKRHDSRSSGFAESFVARSSSASIKSTLPTTKTLTQTIPPCSKTPIQATQFIPISSSKPQFIPIIPISNFDSRESSNTFDNGKHDNQPEGAESQRTPNINRTKADAKTTRIQEITRDRLPSNSPSKVGTMQLSTPTQGSPAVSQSNATRFTAKSSSTSKKLHMSGNSLQIHENATSSSTLTQLKNQLEQTFDQIFGVSTTVSCESRNNQPLPAQTTNSPETLDPGRSSQPPNVFHAKFTSPSPAIKTSESVANPLKDRPFPLQRSLDISSNSDHQPSPSLSKSSVGDKTITKTLTGKENKSKTNHRAMSIDKSTPSTHVSSEADFPNFNLTATSMEPLSVSQTNLEPHLNVLVEAESFAERADSSMLQSVHHAIRGDAKSFAFDRILPQPSPSRPNHSHSQLLDSFQFSSTFLNLSSRLPTFCNRKIHQLLKKSLLALSPTLHPLLIRSVLADPSLVFNCPIELADVALMVTAESDRLQKLSRLLARFNRRVKLQGEQAMVILRDQQSLVP